MNQQTRLIGVAAATALALALTAHAAPFYWDDGTVTVNGVSAGGSGAWTVGAAGWEDGSSAQNWANNNTAILGGAAGTLTLGGTIAATGITVQSPGYKVGSSTGLLWMGVGDWRRLPIDRRGRGGPQRAQSLERNARSGKPESPAACGISGGFHPISCLPLRSQGPLLPLRLPGVRRALASETDEEPQS